MGWERRRGGRMYFYRSVRRGDHVARRYFGRGAAAEQAAKVVELTRQERLEQQQRERAAQQSDAMLVAELDEYLQAHQFVERVVLLVAGLHRHDRGTWRLRRNVGPKARRQTVPRRT